MSSYPNSFTRKTLPTERDLEVPLVCRRFRGQRCTVLVIVVVTCQRAPALLGIGRGTASGGDAVLGVAGEVAHLPRRLLLRLNVFMGRREYGCPAPVRRAGSRSTMKEKT